MEKIGLMIGKWALYAFMVLLVIGALGTLFIAVAHFYGFNTEW